MAEISIKHILDGLSLALHRLRPEAQIHGGTVTQGLKAGDFNITLVSGSQRQWLGRRQRRDAAFDIIYYPADELRPEEDCMAAAEELSVKLRTVELPGGDRLRGLVFNYEIVDGVLHFVIRFPHYVDIIELGDGGTDLMYILEHNIFIKE